MKSSTDKEHSCIGVSLGHKTNFIFNRFNGRVDRLDDGYAVSDERNPDYYFGNYLFLDDPESVTSRAVLEKKFDSTVGRIPGVNHYTFCWQVLSGVEYNHKPFTDAGYEYVQCSVLTLEEACLVKPISINNKLIIRKFSSDNDWSAWQCMVTDEAGSDYPEDTFPAYLAGITKMYRGLIDAGSGNWYGAFHEGELVAALGLFIEDGVGRFQEVRTASAFHRQGAASALIYHACIEGFKTANKLVIVADDSYHAIHLYQKLGFKVEGHEASLCWWPK